VLTDVEGLAEVFYQRGVMYVTQRRLDDAGEQLSLALSKAEAIDNKYQQIRARMQLSSVFCLKGDTQAAERYAAEALDFAKANGLENSTANGMVTLGNAFLARGDLGQAQKYLARALEVAQLYKARRSEARVLLALASVATQHHSKPAEVRAYVERALSLYQQEGSRKYAMQALLLLGHAADEQGDYSSARGAFEQQLQLAAQLDDREQTALGHEGLGIVLARQEEYSKALENFDHAYEISKSLNLSPNITHALSNRGRLLWQLGFYDGAEQALAEALNEATKQEKPDAEVLTRLHLINAQMALSRRRFEAAIAEARKATETARGEFETLTVEAQYTIGMARALSGYTRDGEELCAAALEAARRLDAPRLVSAALLALATARLEAGDSRGALAAAVEARERFKAAGQQESEWRALLVAALASKRLGDAGAAQSYAALVAETFADFRQRLGADANKSYLARPDAIHAREQLEREFAIRF
jgi:tetratricopeptide (TPR) repeat protein